MKQTVIIFLLLSLSTVSVGQTTATSNVSVEAYNTVDKLKLMKSVAAADMIGIFKFQSGSYQWQYLILDSNMSYKIQSQDCLQGKVIDGGSWHISFDRLLTLQTSRRKLVFDILQLNQKYYLVEPAKRAEFIQSIKDSKSLELSFFSKAIY